MLVILGRDRFGHDPHPAGTLQWHDTLGQSRSNCGWTIFGQETKQQISQERWWWPLTHPIRRSYCGHQCRLRIGVRPVPKQSASQPARGIHIGGGRRGQSGQRFNDLSGVGFFFGQNGRHQSRQGWRKRRIRNGCSCRILTPITIAPSLPEQRPSPPQPSLQGARKWLGKNHIKALKSGFDGLPL